MSAGPHAQLAQVAAAQHGAFSLAQAVACGLTPHQVRHQVEIGEWVRLGRGVLAVGGAPPVWEQRAMAALLARPGAVLFGLAAGHLHGVVDAPLDEPTLAVPPGSSSRAAIGRVRRLHVPAEQRTTVRGLQVTTLGRTLVDLAGILPTPQVRAAVDAAIGGRSCSVGALSEAAANATHVPIRAREAVLDSASVWEGIRPGSVGEARLLRSIDEWGLPAPDRQVSLRDGSGTVIARLDTGWRAARVGLEYDGTEWHGPARWAGDEARHRMVESLGWRLLHVGARDLLPSSDLRMRLQRLLAARGGRADPAA